MGVVELSGLDGCLLSFGRDLCAFHVHSFLQLVARLLARLFASRSGKHLGKSLDIMRGPFSTGFSVFKMKNKLENNSHFPH